MTNLYPNYRFLLTAAALLLCIAELARAQATRPADRGAEPPMVQRLQERMEQLDLTDDQKVQFQALKDEIAETMRDMAPGLKNLSPEDRRAKLRTALSDVREKALSILTPEQKQKLRDGGPQAEQVPGAASRPVGADTPIINRMRQAVLALGLTDEQTTKVNTIFDDAAQRATELRQQAAGAKGGDKSERKDMREQVQDLNKEVHEKLAAVLTPEQQAKLKETMPAAGGRGEMLGKGGPKKAARRAEKEKADTPASRPATQPTAQSAPQSTARGDPMNGDAMADGMGDGVAHGGHGMNDSNTSGTTAAKAAAVSSQARPSARPATRPVAVGSPAPAFTAARLSGTEATNKSFTGKPLVIAFGSLTSPTFRDRLPKLEQLKNKYHGRANVVIVYTKEAHPADGWQVERNRDDKVEIKSPTTMKERVTLAGKLKAMSKTSLDILVDDMNESTLHAFGDTPEGAVVVTPGGTVIGTQTYCDASGLPHMIDEALKAKN